MKRLPWILGLGLIAAAILAWVGWKRFETRHIATAHQQHTHLFQFQKNGI